MSNSYSIIFAPDYETYPPITLEISCLKDILSLGKLHYGEEFSSKLLEESFYFVLADSSDKKEPLAIFPEIDFTDIPGYDQILIIPDVEGNPQIGALIWAYSMMAMASIGVGTATAIMIAEGLVLLSGALVSFGASMLMNALSPTPEFSSDPASAQQNTSKLFNGFDVTREQGGPVPLGFGRPFHGGTLISSGLFSEDISG